MATDTTTLPVRLVVDHRREASILVVVLSSFSLIALALQFGFYERPLPNWLLLGVQLSAVLAYAASRLRRLVASLKSGKTLSGWRLDLACLLALMIALAFVSFEQAHKPAINATAVYVAVVQAMLMMRIAVGAFKLNLALSKSKLHPARTILVSFALLIVLGGLALALPKSTTQELHASDGFSVGHHLLNCMFTATSATCVTGLIVYDTATDFTTLGQVIILVLIQAGGLGIMIFASLFGLLAGEQLSLKYSLALQDSLSYRTLGRLRAMVVFIFVTTFLIEAAGAVLLYPMTQGDLGERVFFSVFHAVSAFCNAGFALQSDSLIAFRSAWQTYGVLMPLITIGGLGFPVLFDAVRLVRRRIWPRSDEHTIARLSLHSKLVLWTSAALIILSVPGYLLFQPLEGASPLQRLADALFYAVTCRTAGFNTVDVSESGLTPACHMMGAILMFIGGSPASTAGGVKTVALAVLLLGVWSTIRGRERVEAFGRTIPESVVRRAAVVVIVMFAAVSALSLVLCLTEGVSLRASLFEATSAMGTVGLSTGLTPDLTVVGRMAIMAGMLAGRLGPLTMLIALAGTSASTRYEYPKEQVGIG